MLREGGRPGAVAAAQVSIALPTDLAVLDWEEPCLVSLDQPGASADVRSAERCAPPVPRPLTAGLLKGIAAHYTAQYEAHPVRTLSLANGFLSSVSDLVAQGIEASVRAAAGRR